MTDPDVPKQRVRLERAGAIGVIVIDNPPVNAGSWEVRSGLLAAVQEVADDRSLTAAVLIGAGTTFIAGSDIKEFDSPLRDPQVPAVITALEACPKPIVAAIHGASLGGGFEVALGCDARVATADALVGLPEVQLGIIPGAGGTQRVPRLSGVTTAIELITTGRRVPSLEAVSIGLIDAIADGDLRRFAIAYAVGLNGQKRRVRDRNVPPFDKDEVNAVAAAAERRARRNPAIVEAIRMTRRAAAAPIDDGLREEREVFQRLRLSETAAALRYQFFSERQAGRLKSGAKGDPKPVKRVAVIGGGTMGVGIAVSFLDAGIPVNLIECDRAALAAAKQRLRTTYDRLVSSGRLSDHEAARRLAMMTASTDYATIIDVDVAVEAVFEEMDVKCNVLAQLDNVLRPDAIIGSNTSYLDLDRLGGATKNPERVVGLHFFAPANVMRLLEVVRTDKTSHDTMVTALALAKRLRKVPVVARVCEGFIGNRIYMAYRRECEIALEEGAYPEQVDAALEAFGFAMGPFAVTDMSGLDIAWRARKRLASTRDPRERYVDILDRLCEAGRFGRKTQAGWYRYSADGMRGGADPDVRELIDIVSREKGIVRRAFTPEQLQHRAVGAMLNEAALVFEDGIAERASDVDLVVVNGYGFPAERGGILFWASRQDRKMIERIIDEVAADIGFGFRRADLDRAFRNLGGE